MLRGVYPLEWVFSGILWPYLRIPCRKIAYA